MALDLNTLTVFAAVARTGGFASAAKQLGVTRSAASQAVRRLEDAIGAVVLRRTTRSVALTEIGAALLADVGPSLAEIAAAADRAGDRDARPSGLLRLAVSSIAERFLSGDLLASFSEAHPEVELDIFVTDDEGDIVAAGFDAGIRLGEVIERDMVAVAVSGTQRQIVVGAPAYLERGGTPVHPRELPGHRCIGWRRHPDVAPYRWEFSEDGRDFDVAVAPATTTNDMGVMIRLAAAGAGLTVGLADTFESWLRRGELRAVLLDFCPTFPGFFLFHPGSRTVTPKLRALIDFVRVGSVA